CGHPASHPFPYTTLFRSSGERTLGRGLRFPPSAWATTTTSESTHYCPPTLCQPRCRGSHRQGSCHPYSSRMSRNLISGRRERERSEEHTSELQSREKLVC